MVLYNKKFTREEVELFDKPSYIWTLSNSKIRSSDQRGGWCCPRSPGMVVWTRSPRSHLGTIGKTIFEQTREPQIPTVSHVRPITDQYSLPIDMWPILSNQYNWQHYQLMSSVAWRSPMTFNENLQCKSKFQYLICNLQSQSLFCTLLARYKCIIYINFFSDGLYT